MSEVIRAAAKKWFYESFDCDLLEKMEKAGLIAQAEGFSVSVMAELELEMESAFGAAQSELAVLREERDQWRQMVGHICATIPLADVVASTETGQKTVDYFKALQQRLTAAEQRNADLLELLRNPSDEMVEAGNGEAVVEMEHDSDLGSCGWISNADEVLKEMLKIALKPTESGAS